MSDIAYPVRFEPASCVRRTASCVLDSGGSLVAACDSPYRPVSEDDDIARRIAACLNACRDISTEDLERCGKGNRWKRTWMLRQISQDVMFHSDSKEREE